MAFGNLRSRLSGALSPKKANTINTESLTPHQVLAMTSAGIPVYGDLTVRKATREGYKISPYVYRAVRVIVQAGSVIPWVVTDKEGALIPNHPLTQVLQKPNPEFSGQDLMEFLIAHLELVGNALWQPIIVNGKVKEIWPVMPDLVKPIPSDMRGEWLKGWEVTSVDGRQLIVPSEQFIHFMQIDPGNPYWGMGPLQAAARTIDTDNEALDTQKISMQNRGMPDGIFSFETILTPEQFEETRLQIKENFLTKDKKREPWVLGAGAKWNQMSLNAVEMDFMASRLQNKRDIAGVFGISPIFLGDLEQSSYNNMVEAKKSLYEEVIIPLLDDVKSTLNLRLAPFYSDIIISYDISRIPALREDFTKKVEQAKSLWAMGVPFDQINERLEMGFSEFTGWRTGFLPLNLLPTGAPVKEVTEALELKSLNLQTEEQKTAHWKRVDRRRIGWWGVLAKRIAPLYDAEAEAVAKAIRGRTPDQLALASSEAIEGLKPEWEKIMTAVLSALIEDFGNEITEDLGGEPKSVSQKEKQYKWTFDPMSLAIRAWIIKNGAASVTSILSTNLADVKRVILAGVDNNLGSAAIGANLQQFYTGQSEFKAMRVARTEVCKASSFGSLEAARQSGVAQKKTWLTSRDDRVRDEHAAMDGETVGLDKRFSNGLEFPSEPMCRCVLTFQTGR